MRSLYLYIKEGLKLAITGVGSYLVWYFSGPITAEIARQCFEWYYHLIHGTPSRFSVEFMLTYIPLRGHVTQYAYHYGNVICAGACMPLLYRLSNMVEVFWTGNEISPEPSELCQYTVTEDTTLISFSSESEPLESELPEPGESGLLAKEPDRPYFARALPKPPSVFTYASDPSPLRSLYRSGNQVSENTCWEESFSEARRRMQVACRLRSSG